MGYLLILIFITTSILLFWLSKITLNIETPFYLILAQISGILSSILFSLNFILASRKKFLEKLFGGLDNVYKIHDILGNLGFVLAINHVLFLIVNAIPYAMISLYLFPNINNPSYMFGILAFYVMILLVSLTIFVDIPYRYWKKTHEYMGLVVIFGTIHALLITSDISRYIPLRMWVLGVNSIGIIFYLYKRFIYYFTNPKSNYKVISIDQQKLYLNITFKSLSSEKYLNVLPGQFIFLSLGKNLRDEHPFSVISQEGDTLTIGAKIIGDFTLKLSQLNVDQIVNIHGPFGSFGETTRKAENILLLSGGIGITPFISIIKNIASHKQVVMIHSCKSTDPDIFTKQIEKFLPNFNNFIFKKHFSDVDGRLTAEKILAYAGEVNEDTYTFMCGPTSMMENLNLTLPKIGLRKKRIIYEDFSLK